MVRITAPSLWLPGFAPDMPDPSPHDIELDFHPLPSVLPAANDDDLQASANATAEAESTEFNPAAPVPTQWRVGTDIQQPQSRRHWPVLSRDDVINPGGAVAKFGSNLAAIDTLQRIEAERRLATPAERSTLLRFTGWGGLPASFNLEGTDNTWLERARQLRAQLADEDYEAARASVNNSHYTEIHVIEPIWKAVERFGFTGGRILEPAAGVAHFVGAMPRSLAENSKGTAIEIDRLSGRMLSALYAPGGVDVRVAPFEKTPLPDHWFDLVIGNVPFGKYKVADLSNRAYARFSVHNYFFGRALDLVRPGGLVCFITTSYTMDALDDAARQYIGTQAQLLGAIRLPKGAFAGIASTDVQTDILFLRKREPGEAVADEWLKLSIVPEALRHPHCHERYLQINAWYATQRPAS